MNDSYYYTRMRFHGHHGIAKMHGTTISLSIGPDLGAGPVHFCEYTPEIGLAQVQPRAIDPVRDMTSAEIAAADALLRSITTLPEIER